MDGQQSFKKATIITAVLIVLSGGVYYLGGISPRQTTSPSSTENSKKTLSNQPISLLTLKVQQIVESEEPSDENEVPHEKVAIESESSAKSQASKEGGYLTQETYEKLVGALRYYNDLRSKPLRMVDEEELFKKLTVSTENLALVRKGLQEPQVVSWETSRVVQQTYLYGVNFLVDSLRGEAHDVALAEIKSLIESPQTSDASLPDSFREQLAKTKSLLIFYGFNELKKSGYDVELAAPDEQTRNIYQNVQRYNREIAEESTELSSRFK